MIAQWYTKFIQIRYQVPHKIKHADFFSFYVCSDGGPLSPFTTTASLGRGDRSPSISWRGHDVSVIFLSSCENMCENSPSCCFTNCFLIFCPENVKHVNHFCCHVRPLFVSRLPQLQSFLPAPRGSQGAHDGAVAPQARDIPGSWWNMLQSNTMRVSDESIWWMSYGTVQKPVLQLYIFCIIHHEKPFSVQWFKTGGMRIMTHGLQEHWEACIGWKNKLHVMNWWHKSATYKKSSLGGTKDIWCQVWKRL